VNHSHRPRTSSRILTNVGAVQAWSFIVITGFVHSSCLGMRKLSKRDSDASKSHAKLAVRSISTVTGAGWVCAFAHAERFGLRTLK